MSKGNAVVFGGSSGIGEASARALLVKGQPVTITGRDRERLDRAGERLVAFGSVRTVVADALNRAAVEHAFELSEPVADVVICVSGGKGAGAFRELDLNDVRGALEQKTMAQLTIAQVAAQRLPDDGSITFVTAASARSVIRGTAGLAAVNGALEALIPVLALELAPIRVNAVSPGIIDTPWWDGMPAAARDAFFSTAIGTLPVRRIGTSQEVGELIASIVSAGFLTGSVYEIDGGSHLVSQ
ncbi:MAG TPA: SDR family oxidoreductase [Polyangiaceae bacterium]|nr:SDR family oxidoreductase [Polyangiaceae bacterium]